MVVHVVLSRIRVRVSCLNGMSGDFGRIVGVSERRECEVE